MGEPERSPARPGALASLRRFVGRRAAAERCDLCGTALAPAHQHLVDPASRQIVCSCDPCAILFSDQGGARYRRVPTRVRRLEGFQISVAQWDDLRIPIGLAFFFYSTPAGRVVACYPGPAGATESLLDLAGWDDLARQHAELQALAPDVEALLVRRVGQAHDYLLVPIDRCYELVGLIRASWRGLSGGTEVWEQIEQFFAALRERAHA